MSAERQNNSNPDVIETLAQFLLGNIKREDMGVNNQFVLDYYMGLIEDSPDFKAAVYAKKNEIIVNREKGKRVPLYTDEELAKAKRHRSKKVSNRETAFQPRLFGEAASTTDKPEEQDKATSFNPETSLARLHQEFDRPVRGNDTSSVIYKEISQNRLKLRNEIGLPIARGKSPHVGDGFYKFLVRDIVSNDNFGIFCEYDRVIGTMPDELNEKLGEVKNLIDELLNGGLNRVERFNKYSQFSQEYKEKWNGES